MHRRSISILINARLGSTRLPGKMMLPFAGTSLIELALQKLSAIDFVEQRYFAAAEPELEQMVRRFPQIEYLPRDPDSVKPGYNGNEKVFAHCRRITSDFIFWMNPCSPLLSVETIRHACDVVRSTQHPAYTSVVQFRDWIFDDEGNAITNKQASMISTAHSKKFYRVAHAFHAFERERFVTTWVPWTLTPNDPSLIEIPEEESYDVNTPLEFQVAEVAFLRTKAGQSLG